MRLKILHVIVVVVALVALPVLGLAQGGLVQLGEGIYAYADVGGEDPNNVFAANVGVVVGEDGVLVVDTLTSAEEAEVLLADIRGVTDKPILYVVNTHYHLDHALGNNVFAREGAVIIGHARCREALLASGEEQLANPEMMGLPPDFWANTIIEAPTLAFEQELVIDLGGRTATAKYLGWPSHSAGSVVVVLEQESVIFTGDILFTDFHPFLGEGDLEGWAKTLDAIAAMDMEHIVPGHGPLSTNQDLMDMKAYLAAFDAMATELAASMDDPEQITAAMLEKLPQRSLGDFIVGFNIMMRYAPPGEGEYVH